MESEKNKSITNLLCFYIFIFIFREPILHYKERWSSQMINSLTRYSTFFSVKMVISFTLFGAIQIRILKKDLHFLVSDIFQVL